MIPRLLTCLAVTATVLVIASCAAGSKSPFISDTPAVEIMPAAVEYAPDGRTVFVAEEGTNRVTRRDLRYRGRCGLIRYRMPAAGACRIPPRNPALCRRR